MVRGMLKSIAERLGRGRACADADAPSPNGEPEKPKRRFWHSLCAHVFNDYLDEVEQRAEKAAERHARIRLRAAIYLLLVMIAAACVSLLYLFIRKYLDL